MPDFPKLPIINNPPPRPGQFPDSPHLDPPPSRLSLREKYGALYYFAIGSLILALWLVGSAAVAFYQTRHFWAAIYVLNNPNGTDAARLDAAWLIAHDPASDDAQRLSNVLRKDLPPLARYIVAEGLTPESLRADPKEYAQMVARSEGWPEWLRLLMARPMAYAVVEGYRIPWEPIDELRAKSDPALVLWMTFTRAVMGPGDEATAAHLHEAAAQPGPYQNLAVILDAAARSSDPAERVRRLDEATAWLRTHHPSCTRVWEGWAVQDGHLVLAAPDSPLRPDPSDPRSPGPPKREPDQTSPH